ncbi:hypothetical protein HDU83_000167 [Entophlyctis luteolus]|nr:hypothetical protein HDU83_000167 [Entophlyctis luteolus]
MGCSLLDNEILLVTEYVGGGNVKEWIQDSTRPMSNYARVLIGMDVAKAMAYLHSRGLIHRDLKTENLLVTENGRIKASVLSLNIFNNAKSMLGLDFYMAPEIILCIPFDQRIDIFSYGIVLCELAMGVIASENILTRRIPGFGIRSDEVVEATRLRISRENASFGADESQDVLDDFTTAFLDIAFLSSAEEPSDRCDWKLIMKRLKVLEGNIKETAKEQGLIGCKSFLLLP